MHLLRRIILWTLVVVLTIVIIIPVLLYIPPVQDFARRIAVSQVSKATGWDVRVGYLRLRFPLRLQVDDVMVITAPGDTMIQARSLETGVRLLPLLHGEIDADRLLLDDAAYRMGNRDSAMMLTARVNRFEADGIDYKLGKDASLTLDDALLSGADVLLILKDTVTATPADTASAPTRMTILGRRLRLKDVTYRMQMFPTIDSLGTVIPSAAMTDVRVDLGAHTVDAAELTVDSITATYLTPSAAWLAEHPERAVERTDSAVTDSLYVPWTIRGDRVRFTARSALYGVRDAVPQPGLDINYLAVKKVAIEVDSFYNRGVELRVPLRHLYAEERSGLTLDASGTFAIDSTAMRASDFDIATTFSRLKFDAMMGMGDLTTDPALPLRLKADGQLAIADVCLAMPSMRPMLRDVPSPARASVRADINGTAGRLKISELAVNLPRCLNMRADGSIDNLFDFKRMGGKVNLAGQLIDVNFIKPSVLDAKLAREINVAPTTLRGSIDYHPGLIAGNLTATTGDGRIAAEGRWQQRAESYNATLGIDRFPLQAFMPSLGIEDVSLDAKIDGRGYDPASPKTDLVARIDLHSITYHGETITNTLLTVDLADNVATGSLVSSNEPADIYMTYKAHLTPENYTWDVDGDIRNLDLQRLHLVDTTLYGAVDITTQGSYSPKTGNIDAKLQMHHFDWTYGENHLYTPLIDASFVTSDTLSTARLTTGDLDADIVTYCSLDSTLACISRMPAVIDTVMQSHIADIPALQRAIPPMDMRITAGRANLLSDYLRESGDMAFSRIGLSLHNDSLINLTGGVTNLQIGKTLLDTITIDATQRGNVLAYKLAMNNNPGTMDAFAHVTANGFLASNRMSLQLSQTNIEGEQGFRIGLGTQMTDSVLMLRFIPFNPIIGYKQWSINSDNFVRYNTFTRHFDSNIALSSGESLLKLFTIHDEEHHHHTDSIDGDGQEDVILQIRNIHLQDWLAISPFAPPIKGDLGADLHFGWDTRQLTGKGTVDLNDFYYGGERVGTFTIGMDVSNTSSGVLQADMDLLVDSVKVITARGALNDSTASSPFLLDFSMIRFPLRVVNPFLPKEMAQLRGVLNGSMDITGSMTEPIFNGSINFDSTAVTVGMMGSTFRFSERKIPVDSNVVHFNDFAIEALNNRNLLVNGSVDARSLRNVAMDLTLNGSDLQIVKSDRPRGANLYGKAFVDLDATARGNMHLMAVDARLKILSGTNATYVMENAQQTIQARTAGEMVKFVQFSDSTQMALADSIDESNLSLILDANLVIEQGTTINVDLSADGKDKVQIQGDGNLTFSMTPMNDGRLTGRFNINGGFARYNIPVMGEKRFDFSEGSYIAFTGDMMNPLLNIHATDKMKANVTQEGHNSRLVNFIVGLAVTNSLNNMNVAFDLSTDDDLSIQNELSSMSPEQRANQAMNLLLYKTYTGNGTKASANLSGNPLYSFLSSQINSWMANNIRGVDISFGVDQYKQTIDGSDQTTTSYNYQVSKTLFNDRFKIIIGGNYSTDANTDENFSQNLINDISFEYMLNRSGSMYVRLFRHTGYESILEGEVTQTGVGFVVTRKLNTLRNLFRSPGNKPSSNPPSTPASDDKK